MGVGRPSEARGNGYTVTAVFLHWLMALMTLGSLGLGLYMVGLPLSPAKLKLYSWHKWLGVTIFEFAVVRLLWRATHPAPALPGHIPAWQRAASSLTHGVIYVLLFAIPLSGWLMSSASGFRVVYLGLLPLPDLLPKDKVLAEQLRLLHQTLNYGLAGLLFLHVGAALKHHYVDRDDVLQRMLPWVKAPLRKSP